MDIYEMVSSEFVDRFDDPPAHVIRSPGRVNLIGEHTDYNDGFVMPMAIDQSLHLAIRPRDDRRIRVHSLGLENMISFSLDELARARSGWGEYVKGTAWALREAGYDLEGWDGVVSSEIPIGAGLSSSAALELGTAMAFQIVSGFSWDPVEMARLGQRAENAWVGVNSGIMDQMIIALGVDGSALKIDCRSLDYEPVPLPDGVSVVVIDSSTRRGVSGLADSAYNDRREECVEAARWFGLTSLRDLSLDLLEMEGPRMPPALFRRARHVLTENRRVQAGVAAMRSGEVEKLGELLKEGHASQRDDFETSRREIDALVEIASAHPACYGARLTGGGFGGCVVSLVQEDEVESFQAAISEDYRNTIDREAVFYVTGAAAGVHATES